MGYRRVASRVFGYLAAGLLGLVLHGCTTEDKSSEPVPRVTAAPIAGNAITSTQLYATTRRTIQARFAAGDRYVVGGDTSKRPHQNCKPLSAELLRNPLVRPYAHLENHRNAVLLECIHGASDGDRKRQGWTIVLAQTADNIAERLVGACMRADSGRAGACVQVLLNKENYPWNSNGFIYPITGFVFEGAGPCQAPEGKSGFIGFRHGVTMQYAGGVDSNDKFQYCVTQNVPISFQKTVGLTYATYDVFSRGRIAASYRDKIPGRTFAKQKPAGLKPDSFQAFVRDNEIRAVETGQDAMMDLRAKDAIATLR